MGRQTDFFWRLSFSRLGGSFDFALPASHRRRTGRFGSCYQSPGG
jgi:hypothetical protein